MAKIFFSHSSRDVDVAREIERRLIKKGHTIVVEVGTLPAGKWRQSLGNALQSAEVLVALLTENGLKSPYVASEVGAARVYDEARGMLLLPIVVGEQPEIPLFIADYACFTLHDEERGSVGDLVDKLDEAINQHLTKSSGMPKIFVSHRHKDEDIARALIDLVEVAFQINTRDIRCTSVPGFKIPAGEKTSDRLRNEIKAAEVVLGLLSPDTAESKYVLAELGASWGNGVPTFPLLVRGALFEHVPEPLNERHSLSLFREAECMQLVEDLKRATSLIPRENSMSRIQERAAQLAKASAPAAPTA